MCVGGCVEWALKYNLEVGALAGTVWIGRLTVGTHLIVGVVGRLTMNLVVERGNFKGGGARVWLFT